MSECLRCLEVTACGSPAAFLWLESHGWGGRLDSLALEFNRGPGLWTCFEGQVFSSLFSLLWLTAYELAVWPYSIIQGEYGTL